MKVEEIGMLTIMTPTYNREKKLKDCYNSLLEQTSRRFIWMVIDDGSVDDTEVVVKQWMDERKIEIVYLKKENGGKASALNVGFKNLTTPYACCLDSDDIFSSNAVELAICQLEQIKDDKQCCGIIAISSNMDGSPMGDVIIPESYKKVRISELLQLGNGVECVRFYKTEILKNYSFPIYIGEKFVSPAWLDYEINRKYYFVPSRDVYCLCEYLPDGLTKNKRMIIVRNPNGYTAVKKQSFEFALSIKQIVKHGIMYDCGCIIGKNKNWLKNAPRKGWAILLMPLAWCVYFKKFKKLQKVINSK